jgi:hypothetical protein
MNNTSIFVSLGNYCITSILLKNNNLKYESHPFDWMVSCIDNLNHILSNNYEVLLDKDMYVTIRNKTKNKFYFDKTIKLLPKIKMDHQHHNLLNDDHYNYYKRCISRFDSLLDRYNKLIFIMIQPLYLTKSKPNNTKIKRLYKNLKNKFTDNIKLIVFNIININNKIYKYKNINNKIFIIELDTLMSKKYNTMYFDEKGIVKFIDIINNISKL